MEKGGEVMGVQLWLLGLAGQCGYAAWSCVGLESRAWTDAQAPDFLSQGEATSTRPVEWACWLCECPGSGRGRTFWGEMAPGQKPKLGDQDTRIPLYL